MPARPVLVDCDITLLSPSSRRCQPLFAHLSSALFSFLFFIHPFSSETSIVVSFVPDVSPRFTQFFETNGITVFRWDGVARVSGRPTGIDDLASWLETRARCVGKLKRSSESRRALIFLPRYRDVCFKANVQFGSTYLRWWALIRESRVDVPKSF